MVGRLVLGWTITFCLIILSLHQQNNNGATFCFLICVLSKEEMMGMWCRYNKAHHKHLDAICDVIDGLQAMACSWRHPHILEHLTFFLQMVWENWQLQWGFQVAEGGRTWELYQQGFWYLALKNDCLKLLDWKTRRGRQHYLQRIQVRPSEMRKLICSDNPTFVRQNCIFQGPPTFVDLVFSCFETNAAFTLECQNLSPHPSF